MLRVQEKSSTSTPSVTANLSAHACKHARLHFKVVHSPLDSNLFFQKLQKYVVQWHERAKWIIGRRLCDCVESFEVDSGI